jgi:hypothetical protein
MMKLRLHYDAAFEVTIRRLNLQTFSIHFFAFSSSSSSSFIIYYIAGTGLVIYLVLSAFFFFIAILVIGYAHLLHWNI